MRVSGRAKFKRAMSKLKAEMHPLLSRENIEKLRTKNIHGVQHFVDAEVTLLATTMGLTFKNVLVIKKHLFNKNAALVRPALEYYKELLKRTAIISTGVKCLDDLLEGGLYTGNIYEVCGPPASLKTQFCLQIASKYTKKHQQKILYIDTKGDFSSYRLKQFAGSFEEVVLNNTLVQRINDLQELINSLYDVKKVLGNSLRLRVIIIDSLPALVYQCEQFERRNTLINCLMNVLRCICVEYHVVVLVTNVMTPWRENSDFNSSVGVVRKVGCGKLWEGVPNTRLEFSKLHDGRCEVKILKSCQLKEGSLCTMRLTHEGFV